MITTIPHLTPTANICILQLQGEHEKEIIESELTAIQNTLPAQNFCILTVPVADWNQEMSPWEVPSQFGTGDFGNGAADKLKEIVENIIPEFEAVYPNPNRKYYLAGYSLAGLFSLWSAYNSDRFDGIAAVSPSVWYPDWLDYAMAGVCNASKVYLSLGNKESKTRNKMMSPVADNITTQHELLKSQNIITTLEWNEGNHFANVPDRMARAIIWLLKNI